MKPLRILIHATVLVIADLGGIVGGAGVAFLVLRTANQVWLQLPVAVVLTVAGFWIWLRALPVAGLRRLEPATMGERCGCWAVSIVLAPLLFVPIHYFTQGYLTDPGNLMALCFYQVPVNAVALAIGSARRKATVAP